MPEDKTNSPAFKISRRQLNARPASPAIHVKPPRLFSLRKAIWLFEIIIVLAVIEHFLIRPRMAQPEQPPQELPKGDLIPALGENARPPKGMSEVSPAYLPILANLPAEVLPAVQKQLDVSGHRRLPVETVNSIGMHFRLVPDGSCMIGSPDSEPGHAVVELQHTVAFPKPFYMGVHEVTQAQWNAVMGQETNPSHFRGDALPVEEVSWTQAMEFCRKLSASEGLQKYAYRLPNEAAWEYACRAGTTTAFCFGNDLARLTDYADFDENNYKRTSPVGRKLPNAFGIHDMHGNVWEWCYDLYKNYPGDDTPRSAAHSYRCVRGGNWYVQARDCRSANRCRLPDQSVGNMLGFRIIRIIE